MKLRTIILSGFILPLAGPALGQIPDECKAKYGPIDLCARARAISDRLAPALPMRVSSETTITTIVAAGNRVIMTATWELTEAQYREQLTIYHITPEQFEAHMQQLTQRFACGQEAAAAFVTLGGQFSTTIFLATVTRLSRRSSTTAAKVPLNVVAKRTFWPRRIGGIPKHGESKRLI